MALYIQLLPYILLLPLLSSLLHYLPLLSSKSKLHHPIATFTTGVSLLLTLIILIQYQVTPEFAANQQLWEWFNFNGLSLSITIQLDHLSIVMGLMVTTITFLVTLYSRDFMADQPQGAYYGALTFFLPAMLLLVYASNLITLFVGWEGIGLASYLLIGYKRGSQEGEAGARRTFQVNRIGDIALLIAIFILLMHHKSLNFSDILPRSTETGSSTVIWITLLIFIAAVAKSAQAPLFIWLPKAMAAPTPISALLHAATMVTAGIYLIIRFAPLFNQVPMVKMVIAITGTITLLIGALVAIRQNNIKKILAYSTISQLGYIFLALGIGAYKIAFFHLITHAFFKALLFLSAANMVYASNGIKDITQLSGKLNHPLMKTTRFTFLIGIIGITGTIPFIAGFLSKDAILWELFISDLPPLLRIILWITALITVALTALYMWRLYFILYPVVENNELPYRKYPSRLMNHVLWILSILTLLSGFIYLPAFLLKKIIPLHFLPYWLSELPDPISAHPLVHHVSVEMLLMFLAWFLVVILLIATRWFYSKADQITIPPIVLWLTTPFEKQFYLDYLVDRGGYYIHLVIYRWLWKTVEYFLIDLLITRIILGWGVVLAGKLLSAMQTGNPRLYLALSAGALLVLMITIIG